MKEKENEYGMAYERRSRKYIYNNKRKEEKKDNGKIM